MISLIMDFVYDYMQVVPRNEPKCSCNSPLDKMPLYTLTLATEDKYINEFFSSSNPSQYNKYCAHQLDPISYLSCFYIRFKIKSLLKFI